MRTFPRFLLFLSAYLVLLALGGCNLPATDVPTCAPSELQAVTLVSPAMYETTDELTPVLRWEYPESDCRPDGYLIFFRIGPDFAASEVSVELSGDVTSWTPAPPLQPAQSYSWSIAPLSGGTRGPMAGAFYFFTGPRCADPTAMTAPSLLWPEEGGLYEPAYDNGLLWANASSCQPDGYRIDLASDPSFPDEGLSGGTGNPATRWAPADDLNACQTYYWRVAGVMDTPTGTVLGPYSETRSFIAAADGEDCTAGGDTGMPPSNAIRGRVWHDLCSLTDLPLPDPPPEGCVSTPDGNARADGIHQRDEPGIAGVSVSLYNADCSGAPLATALTDDNGIYELIAPGAGDYCVAIDALAPPNDALLLPGGWTYPVVAAAGRITQAVTLSASSASGADFGWDYQRLPAPREVWFYFESNAFCRQGPSTAYKDVTAIPAGELLPVLARNPNEGWFFIDWAPYDARCWVSESTGRVIGQWQALDIFTPIPLPTIAPADAEGPRISDVRALSNRLYHSGTTCGSTLLEVGARLNDPAGIDEDNTFLRYRFVGAGGAASGWRRVDVTDRAMGGQFGFSTDIAAAGGAYLGTTDGQLEYQVVAQDALGNQTLSAVYSLPVYYCKK